MGISGLLPFLKDVLKKKSISNYKNKRICIDGHSWLHQVAISVAYELYNNIPTNRHVLMFQRKIKTLQKHKITPIFVFDGDLIPAKMPTIVSRRNAREKSQDQLQASLDAGDSYRARELMKRVIKITDEFVFEILKDLERQKIEYLIAPYEADPQMAYLKEINYVDCILTEDSDLIAYGATDVLYKFNGTTVDEFNKNLLVKTKPDSFVNNILEICIFSGCDYLPSIKGIGLLTAVKEFEKNQNINSVVDSVRAKKEVPADYIQNFYEAKKAFMHHIVYDPQLRMRVNFTSTEESSEILGTLEELPYQMLIEDDEFEIPRHFIPGLKTQEDDEKENNKQSQNTSIDNDSVEMNPISPENIDLATELISEFTVDEN